VIQGYAALAAVDSKHQVIVDADVVGSVSEQLTLLPMVEQSQVVSKETTLITAAAANAPADRLTPRSAKLQPTARYGRTRVCQHSAQQATEPIHPTRPMQGERAVAFVLPRA
jgi:hypothetical protein